MASEAISECQIFLTFSWGGLPPDPPTLFTLTHTQWPYQSEIAGAGPVLCANCNSHEDDRLYLPYMGHQGIIIDTRF